MQPAVQSSSNLAFIPSVYYLRVITDFSKVALKFVFHWDCYWKGKGVLSFTIFEIHEKAFQGVYQKGKCHKMEV
jgi:hypothetical protein